jgi:predicted ATPase
LQQELDVQVALGLALIANKGYAAPEVVRAYTRAQALCQQVGNTPQLFQILSGLWLFYVVGGAYWTAYELAEQGIAITRDQPEGAPLLEAYTLMGTSQLFLGQLRSAHTHFEKAKALFHAVQQRAIDLRYGLDPTIQCHTYSALTLWLLGYPQQSAEQNPLSRSTQK